MSEKKNKKQKEFVKVYVPELMQIMDSGDEKSCLMMAQIEYWFGKQPNGFYKFMTPPNSENPFYKEGDSWTEEMGMSKDKINNALRPICIQYKSFTEYKNEEDKFKGRYYCSYYHKLSHRTYYFRNHNLTNEALKSISLENKSSIFAKKHSSHSDKVENYVSGEVVNGFTEIKNDEIVYTENRTKNNTDTIQREFPALTTDEIITKEVNGVYEKVEVKEYSDSSTSDLLLNGNNGSSGKTRNIKTPFPANFELTAQMIDWAKTHNPEIDVDRTTHKFKIFYKNKMNDDWLTAWQMWIMNEQPNKKSSLDQLAAYSQAFEMIKNLDDDED